VGAILTPKSANFDTFYPVFSILTIFPQKMLILTIFSQKNCNFGQFSTSESEKYGEIFFTIFSLVWEKIIFLAEYSPMMSLYDINFNMKMSFFFSLLSPIINLN